MAVQKDPKSFFCYLPFRDYTARTNRQVQGDKMSRSTRNRAGLEAVHPARENMKGTISFRSIKALRSGAENKDTVPKGKSAFWSGAEVPLCTSATSKVVDDLRQERCGSPELGSPPLSSPSVLPASTKKVAVRQVMLAGVCAQIDLRRTPRVYRSVGNKSTFILHLQCTWHLFGALSIENSCAVVHCDLSMLVRDCSSWGETVA